MRPRAATLGPRSWAEAVRTPFSRGGDQEELPYMTEVRGDSHAELPSAQGQGRWPRVPGCDIAGAVERSYPTPEARGGGREEQPHGQGAVAAWAQEGLEELFHVPNLTIS